jgi:NAD(P)-dependent dehydrogenase (short-subunit alcohol dehydrogenase family)
MPDHKTAIITGASRGIGTGLVEAFLKQGYNVVATSRNVSQQLTASTALILIDGDIGKPETAAKVVEAAIKKFGGIDVLVSNAGIFFTKPFTDFSTADFNALVSTNLCNSGDVYFLRARLNVSLPGLEREAAQVIVDATHAETCAYSNATRGNIDVTLNVV